MEHTDIYSEFCKDRFDRLEAKFDDLNGKITEVVPSHDNRIKKLESTNKTVWGAVIFVFATVFVQAFIWLREQLK